MTKITPLTNLVDLENQTTAVNAINTNNASITTALTNTLSRDGSVPNTMGANLDMNSMQIINLPAPATINSPARLVDVTSPATIASVPPVGTSGAVVGLLNANNTISGNNIYSGTSTFNGIATLTSAVFITPILGTPTSGTLTNTTGFPAANLAGLGAGVATFLATPTSANFAAAVTGETGTGSVVFNTSPTFIAPILGAATGTSLAVIGALTSSGATTGIGYAIGAGGTVTQLTGKGTAVTLNTMSGSITMNASALASGTPNQFLFNNSNIASTDALILNIASGATGQSYNIWVDAIAAGVATITIKNISGGSLSEAVVIRFVIIKGVNS